MVSEANRIISLVCIIALVGCNGKIRDPSLSQDSEPLAQKTDSNIDSENHNVKNHNFDLKHLDSPTCPQHCTCDIENSRFQSIECSLANVSQDNGLTSPSDLSSCGPVFNTSDVAFYYLKTLSVTGCTLLTNLTTSTLPTGYSLTHLKLSQGGLNNVEPDSLLALGPSLNTWTLLITKFHICQWNFSNL